ncbi:MAG: ATP synthase subunit I [Leptolyngbyaceae cyanobacterium]
MTISLIMKGLGFLLVGLSLGIVYFGGLWFTLRRLHAWRKPYLWLAMSWFGRLAILLGGGAWLLNQTVASPLMVILLVSIGVWMGRTLLIARLLSVVERSGATARPGVSRSLKELSP